MMAPEAYEAAPPAPALERAAPPGASGSEAADPEGRAPLQWPFRTREQQARAQQRAAEAAKIESEPESEMESDNESLQSADGRERDEQVESDSEELSQLLFAASSPPATHTCTSHKHAIHCAMVL